MAPASPFPEIPMDQVQKNEVEKAYHLMYKHIAEEFVHWNDLKIILQNGNLMVNSEVKTVVTGSSATGGPVTGTGLGVGSQTTTNFIYQDKAQALGRITEHEARARGLKKAQDTIIAGVETALT